MFEKDYELCKKYDDLFQVCIKKYGLKSSHSLLLLQSTTYNFTVWNIFWLQSFAGNKTTSVPLAPHQVAALEHSFGGNMKKPLAFEKWRENQIIIFTKSLDMTDDVMFKMGLQKELSGKENSYRCYSYNLDTYNNKRSWNNPDGWANPENFNKFRW